MSGFALRRRQTLPSARKPGIRRAFSSAGEPRFDLGTANSASTPGLRTREGPFVSRLNWKEGYYFSHYARLAFRVLYEVLVCLSGGSVRVYGICCFRSHVPPCRIDTEKRIGTRSP